MIQRDPSTPYDSKAETLATHYREEATASSATQDTTQLRADLARFEAARDRQGLNTPSYLEYDSLCADIRAELAAASTPTQAFLADLRSIHAVDPRQAVSDLAHDEKTEGYARRPFRTNPHD